MKLKVGDVVNKQDGIFIVTDISSDNKVEFEDFKEFISKNYAIEFEGEHRTLNDITIMIGEKYLADSDRTIIDLDDQRKENKVPKWKCNECGFEFYGINLVCPSCEFSDAEKVEY